MLRYIVKYLITSRKEYIFICVLFAKISNFAVLTLPAEYILQVGNNLCLDACVINYTQSLYIHMETASGIL